VHQIAKLLDVPIPDSMLVQAALPSVGLRSNDDTTPCAPSASLGARSTYIGNPSPMKTGQGDDNLDADRLSQHRKR
jgi:hypothetical protein